MDQIKNCPCKSPKGKHPDAAKHEDQPTIAKRVISTPNAPRAVGPYNQAIVFGDTVYVSGCLGLNKDTMKLVEGGAVAEAKQALISLGHILEAAGSSYANVLKTTIYLDNIADFHAINEVYKEFFHQHYPARSCFQVGKLPVGAKFEIDAIAGRKSEDKSPDNVEL
ncbi:hypothetical protein Trydic_g19745 [Trypoxylus dichotomus]